MENFNGPTLLWRQLLRSRGQFRVARDRLPPPVAGPGPRQPQQQQPAVGAFNAPAPLQGQLLQSWVQYHHTTSPMWCPVGQLWPWCWLLRAAAGNGHGNRNRHPHPHAHAHASRNTTVIGYSLYVGVGYPVIERPPGVPFQKIQFGNERGGRSVLSRLPELRIARILAHLGV